MAAEEISPPVEKIRDKWTAAIRRLMVTFADEDHISQMKERCKEDRAEI